jgi:hypothetical protein
MKETVQQYIQRISGYAEGKQPLAVQASTAKKLERLIKGKSTAKLRKRPAPDKWSVSEILAHLADAETVGSFRMRLISGRAGHSDCGVRPGRMGDQRALRETRSAEISRVVSRAAGSQSALLKSLTPEQWKHHGMHAERGQESIEHIVRMFAGHDINHLQQIERILGRK